MFQTASPVFVRKFLLALALGATLMVAGAGAAVWAFTQCNMLDYLDRAALVPSRPQERYLFACGYLWRSMDGGRRWVRQSVRGLPVGVRDGHIAVDRRPGTLYLGILINSQSSRYCWNCAWTKLRPAIYVSQDGGRHWTYTYKFRRGPAEDGGFLLLMADPDHEGWVWAVIKNADEITFYGSGTSGQFWKDYCREYYFPGSSGCRLPENVQQFRLNRIEPGQSVGQ
jgi:hypothetical protein